MATVLFVYGSLRRDVSGAHHPLMRHAVFLGAATIAGRLYRVSWHPGLKPGPGGGRVTGEAFRFDDAVEARAFADLDAYEASGFRLTPVQAQLADGTTLDAVTYEWLGDASQATLVPDGDWGAPAAHARE